jgi:serine/threonine-protein kinase
MGSVYRVSDANGGEWAAKVLYFDDPVAQELQRFRREFRVLQQLSHPALLRAFDYGEEAGMAYCICEFVQGRTLNHYLRPQGQPWSTIWPWVEGILEGLSCAHQAGVVHRDLKPSNIMISESGVKILDFGLARQAQITAVTLTGQAFGTPTYMAPEQISASGTEVDVRSDLYSLGIILFELVSGRPPFQADDVQDIITQHLTLAPPPLSSRATDVPEGLDAVVSTLLAKKPANRYASAQRVLEVLRGLNTGPAQAAETADQTLPSPDTLPVVRRSREGGANC